MAFGILSYGSAAYGGKVVQFVEELPPYYVPAPESDYGDEHMSTTAVDVANAALTKIGAPLITSLSEGNNRAVTMNARIEWCKWAVLRLHNWNFAQRRVVLQPKTITGVADNGGGLIRITSVAHGFSTGDRARIVGVGGTTEANANWVVSVIDGDTLDLQASTFSSAWTTGGLIGRNPVHTYDWSYDLPTDFLRFTSGDESTDFEWRLENGSILTDETSIHMLYIANVTNYGLMDVLFRECLATHLAIDTCIKITQSNQLLEQLTEYFKVILPKSRFVDATEDSVRKLQADEFITSRFGQNFGRGVHGQY